MKSEPCPMCGSQDLRWRRRNPLDFVFTWLRWAIELLASIFAGKQQAGDTQAAYADLTSTYAQAVDERRREFTRGEMREAGTGHKTPKRFWNYRACKRKGHVFN